MSASVGRWRRVRAAVAAVARGALVLLALITAGLASAGSEPGKVQSFLVRKNYLSLGPDGMQKALQYRLATYTGIRPTTFFGRGVQLHEAAIGPLSCVEADIRANCQDPYRPTTLSGWRAQNTFKQQPDWRYQEYSNHIFGLALDIDPDKNPCCGCVKDWAKAERCRVGARDMGKDKTPIGRHDIPQCWIDAFKRHGFYWLGDDPLLRDTMHFEFLAAPGSVTCPTE